MDGSFQRLESGSPAGNRRRRKEGSPRREHGVPGGPRPGQGAGLPGHRGASPRLASALPAPAPHLLHGTPGRHPGPAGPTPPGLGLRLGRELFQGPPGADAGGVRGGDAPVSRTNRTGSRPSRQFPPPSNFLILRSRHRPKHRHQRRRRRSVSTAHPAPPAPMRAGRLPSPTPAKGPRGPPVPLAPGSAEKRPLSGRGPPGAPRPRRRVSPNCPAHASGKRPAAARTWPAGPRPLPALPPRPESGPPASRRRSPRPGQTPAQGLHAPCPEPPPLRGPTSSGRGATEAPQAADPATPPRGRVPSACLSAPLEGVSRGAELAGRPVLPDNLSPPTTLTWRAPAAGVGGRASRPPARPPRPHPPAPAPCQRAPQARRAPEAPGVGGGGKGGRRTWPRERQGGGGAGRTDTRGERGQGARRKQRLGGVRGEKAAWSVSVMARGGGDSSGLPIPSPLV